MNAWHPVGTRDQARPDEPLAALAAGLPVGVYDVGGALHAIADTCPHAEAMLTQGFAEGCEVECPLHGAVFDVTTGKHLRGTLCDDVRSYPVRVVDGQIEVQVPA